MFWLLKSKSAEDFLTLLQSIYFDLFLHFAGNQIVFRFHFEIITMDFARSLDPTLILLC